MITRKCTKADNQAQAAKAKEKGQSFGPLVVRIESVDKASQKVTFSTKGSRKTYSVHWAGPDVWIECPTTIVSPPGGLPDIHAEGTLYVGTNVVQALDHAARQFLMIKWPIEAPMDAEHNDAPHSAYTALSLSASSIQITANVSKQPGDLTFDLLEPGSPNKTLDLTGVYSTLHVKDHGTGEFHSVEMKITRAVMHATCFSTGIPSKFDLLDPALSDAFQVIDITDRSQIESRLSPRGFALFGVGLHP
jgi:hypothetical protein